MGLGGKLGVYSVQCTVYSGHRVYSAVQAAPTGSGVTRVRAQSRPVRRQTPASEQTSGPGRHWTLDSQTLQAFIIRRTLTKMGRGHHVPVLVKRAFSVRA